jgi:hypothetical protein
MENLLGLKSYPGIKNLAKSAKCGEGHNDYSKIFYSTFYKAISAEVDTSRKPGDKHGLESCIKTAMTATIKKILQKNGNIRFYKCTVPVPGLPRGKSPDFALTNGKRHYFIEQKSILRFNEFGEALTEGIIFHNEFGNNARFVTLFHYLHQPQNTFEHISKVFGRKIIHNIFVLINDWDNGYEISVVKNLFNDMEKWLNKKATLNARGKTQDMQRNTIGQQ